MRRFHDLRHTATTNDAATRCRPVAIMTKAGHANMATTKIYLHLAGVVFRGEANALEQRPLGTEHDDARGPIGISDERAEAKRRSVRDGVLTAERDTALPQVTFTPAT